MCCFVSHYGWPLLAVSCRCGTAVTPCQFVACRAWVQGDVKFEGFLNRLSQTSTPKIRQRVRKPAPETRCVDLFLVLRMLIVEYREEQAHRCVCVVCVCLCIPLFVPRVWPFIGS